MTVHAIEGERTETREPKAPSHVWLDEITLDPRNEWLIKGMLPRCGMACGWGAESTGKTFIAVDIGVSVAAGRSWRGRRVERGGVVFVAVEDSGGVRKRLLAYCAHHGVEREALPFVLYEDPIDLQSDGDTTAFIAWLSTLPGRMGYPVRMVTIDTLTKAMPGGNENGPDDMGRVVRNLDRIRRSIDGLVFLVHHAGKDTDRGMRGHSSLPFGLETHFHVIGQENPRTVTFGKVKNGELPPPFHFDLERVELGHDEDGEPITSCAVAHRAQAASPATRVTMTDSQEAFYLVLLEAGSAGLTVGEWNSRAREQGLGMTRPANFIRWRAALTAKGVVRQYGERFFVNHNGG